MKVLDIRFSLKDKGLHIGFTKVIIDSMIKAILFDVDGVLLDFFEANYRFMSDLVAHFGYKRPSRKFFSSIFHHNYYDAIRLLTSLRSEKELQKIAQYGLGDQISRYGELQKLPEKAKETVSLLRKKYLLGIVTSRVKYGVFKHPKLADIVKEFLVIVSYEDTIKHKPNADPLLTAAKKLKLNPDEVIYIGDTEIDIQAAKAAGMKIIIYAKSKIEGADGFAFSFSDLPNLISTLD